MFRVMQKKFRLRKNICYPIETLLTSIVSSEYNKYVVSGMSIMVKQRGRFTENESLFAHEVLENNDNYNQTVVLHPSKTVMNENYKIKIKDKSVFQLFYKTTLRNLKEQNSLNDEMFAALTRSIRMGFSKADFDDIQLALFCMCLWPNDTFRQKRHRLLWNEIDVECVKRLKNWSTDEKLLIGDYWFHLGLSRSTLYNNQMITDLTQCCDNLTQFQFVQLMFYISLQRNCTSSIFDVLSKVFQTLINTVSIQELSIICLAYFKNDIRLKNVNILKTVIERVTSEINDLNSITMVRLIKFLRKSFQPHITKYYVPLIKSCTIHLDRWDIFAFVHISLLCSTTLIFEPFLLDIIVDNFKNNLSTARLKDIFRIVQSLSQFNYMPHSDFHDLLFEEFLKPHRLDEILAFPKDLLGLLLFYAYMGKYPMNLIKNVFHPNFIEHCLNQEDETINVTLATLDYCVQIDCDNYDGPRLQPFLRNLKQGNLLSQGDSEHCVLINIIKKLYSGVGHFLDQNDYTLRHVLPHMFTPDLIIRLPQGKSKTSLEDIVKQCPSKDILSPPPDETWGCFVACGPFHYSYNSNRLCSKMVMKQRHLTKLGYKVELIPFREFPYYEKQQLTYIKNKLDLLFSHIIS